MLESFRATIRDYLIEFHWVGAWYPDGRPAWWKPLAKFGPSFPMYTVDGRQLWSHRFRRWFIKSFIVEINWKPVYHERGYPPRPRLDLRYA